MNRTTTTSTLIPRVPRELTAPQPKGPLVPSSAKKAEAVTAFLQQACTGVLIGLWECGPDKQASDPRKFQLQSQALLGQYLNECWMSLLRQDDPFVDESFELMAHRSPSCLMQHLFTLGSQLLPKTPLLPGHINKLDKAMAERQEKTLLLEEARIDRMLVLLDAQHDEGEEVEEEEEEDDLTEEEERYFEQLAEDEAHSAERATEQFQALLNKRAVTVFTGASIVKGGVIISALNHECFGMTLEEERIDWRERGKPIDGLFSIHT